MRPNWSIICAALGIQKLNATREFDHFSDANILKEALFNEEHMFRFLSKIFCLTWILVHYIAYVRIEYGIFFCEFENYNISNVASSMYSRFNLIVLKTFLQTFSKEICNFSYHGYLVLCIKVVFHSILSAYFYVHYAIWAYCRYVWHVALYFHFLPGVTIFVALIAISIPMSDFPNCTKKCCYGPCKVAW